MTGESGMLMVAKIGYKMSGLGRALKFYISIERRKRDS